VSASTTQVRTTSQRPVVPESRTTSPAPSRHDKSTNGRPYHSGQRHRTGTVPSPSRRLGATVAASDHVSDSLLIIRLIIETILLDPSGSSGPTGHPNVSRLDPPGVDQADAEHPSPNRKVRVRVRFAPSFGRNRVAVGRFVVTRALWGWRRGDLNPWLPPCEGAKGSRGDLRSVGRMLAELGRWRAGGDRDCPLRSDLFVARMWPRRGPTGYGSAAHGPPSLGLRWLGWPIAPRESLDPETNHGSGSKDQQENDDPGHRWLLASS
jgi:hypothetical protein